ncbi:hypothetical protein WA026_015096 [Henosepilachna vigintioctopunctata]|uniref:Uncharacterized protein n=1 Tax=Henosepilachna vigintioctopunctata TaxID=420089 RepID=A0AAW1U2T4_9CUCU
MLDAITFKSQPGTYEKGTLGASQNFLFDLESKQSEAVPKNEYQALGYVNIEVHINRMKLARVRDIKTKKGCNGHNVSYVRDYLAKFTTLSAAIYIPKLREDRRLANFKFLYSSLSLTIKASDFEGYAARSGKEFLFAEAAGPWHKMRKPGSS